MKAPAQTDIEFFPIIPIDDDTRAMLAYAASPGRACASSKLAGSCKKARASSSGSALVGDEHGFVDPEKR